MKRLAMDRMSVVHERARDNFSLRRLAQDKSVRSYDFDGRLHITRANISKATVNPYVGNEIPDAEKLGLDPKKIYYLYRDPEELEKGAATFNGLPLLSKHQPVTADAHDHDLVVGSTGNDAKFEPPYLVNSLVIWPEADIKKIENDDKRQLSCGYRYTADMTPGVSPKGEKYDGVMRDIVGNHVALVEEGRAGSDVVVGDSALKQRRNHMPKLMTQRAARTIRYLAPYVRSKLAQDAAVDLRKLLVPLTAKDWDRDTLLKGIQKATKGKLAKDANLGEVAELLDMIDSHGEDQGDESVSKAQHNAMEAAAHGKSNIGIPKKVGKEFEQKDKGKSFDEEEVGNHPFHEAHGKVHSFLKDKLTAEDLDTVHEMLNGGGEEGHHEDEHEDEESEEFHGGKDEENESPEEHLEELGAADEDEDGFGETEKEEKEENEREEPSMDRKHAKDRRKGHDEPPPFKGRPRPGGSMDKHAKDKHAKDRRGGYDRHGMDQAISKAVKDATDKVRVEAKALREAENFVRPWVGDLNNIALDSADKVFEHALKTMKVDVKGVHPSAFRAILSQVPLPGTAKPRIPSKEQIAADAKKTTSYAERFPGTARLRVV